MGTKLVRKRYGYGIVAADGSIYMSESCVCEDRRPMEDEVKMLNDDEENGHPYKVVTLYYMAADPSEVSK